MNQKELFHVTKFPWFFVERNRVTITLRTEKKITQAEVWYCDPCDFICNEKKTPNFKRSNMDFVFRDSEYFYFQTEITMNSHKLRYQFRIEEENKEWYFSENGMTDTAEEEQIRPFLIPYVYDMDQCVRPDWVAQMNWYQIFPDRFSNGIGDKEAIRFVPDRENFYGGTLKGIQKKIPYLKELGINGIYLNPIFASTSNHRYDTKDYWMIEPLLGTKEELQCLVETCHLNEMRIMLDGVYNHCGYDSPIWQDVLKYGKRSKYYNWFYIYDEKALQREDCRMLTSERMKQNPPYEAFAFAANMPKWNTTNPEVMDYLISSAEYWTKYLNVDAWRLDVPDEVNKTFLREFYRRIKKIRPDCYIIGEIWQDADLWFSERIFDGVMDYPFYFAVRDFMLLGNIDAYEFCNRITRHTLLLPRKIQQNNFHFISNHDLPRAITVAGNDKKAWLDAYRFIAFFGGGLNVYYGDEVGLEGENDPDCRRVYPWYFTDNTLIAEFQQILTERIGWIRTGLEPLDENRIKMYLEKDNIKREIIFEKKSNNFPK